VIGLLSNFGGLLRRHRLRLAAASGVLALSVVGELAQPWPLKLIVDSVLGNRPMPGWFPDFVRTGSQDVRIGVLCGALLVVVGLGGLLEYAGTYWAQSVGQRAMFDIREAVHAHMHRLSLAYHHAHQPGDLANRLTADVDRIQDVVIAVVVNLVTGILMLTGMLAIMFYVSWRFTLLALAVTPLLFATVFVYTNRIKWSARRARRQEGQVAAAVQESLGAIHLVQAFTREDHERERFRTRASGSLDASLEATMLQARFSPLVQFLTAVATVLVLWVGAHEVLRGRMTLGLLLVFLSYLSSLYKPMRQLSKLSYMMSRGTAAAERLQEVVEAAPTLPPSPHPHRPVRVYGRVEFEGVSFRYPTGKQDALCAISFTAEPCRTVALVGATGAGKSTLVGLIPRFYDVYAGAVRVDGVDVREWDLHTLRSQISLVLQDTWLFQTSVAENIAYGSPGASQRDLLRAAKAANVDEFIERLPKGYDTVVGPRGATLSGGQRQRIAIARAMLRNAPLLILDEPTTGLDRGSEALVLQALRRLMSRSTTFVIAHGEAPVVGADQVLVLDHGRVVERGGDGLAAARRGKRPLTALTGETPA
jgi:subfamily B ATP-binding cassette protein MsbA